MSQDKVLQNLAKILDELFPELYGQKMGFALLVFPFDNPSGDYVSNVERSDMVKAMREIANRIEDNEVIPPTIGSA